MAIDTSNAPRILVVRRDNVGDLVCTTPLIHALRERLPKAWIGALVNTYNAAVLARNPSLDAVFVYEKLKHRSGSLLSNLFKRMKLASSLRSEKLDYVLVPAASPRTLRLAAILKPRQLIVGEPASDAHLHEVERSFALGRTLGVEGTPGPMRVYPDTEIQRGLRERLGPGPFVAVQISARRPAQRWPIERYAELVRVLAREARVLILWAPGARDAARHPGDDELAAQLLARVQGDAVVPLPADLPTLIAAFSLAERVVCPDGGAMHLAAALGKPLVALFGDMPPERWRPWGVPHRVVRPDSKNLADLPLAAVLDAYADLAREVGLKAE